MRRFIKNIISGIFALSSYFVFMIGLTWAFDISTKTTVFALVFVPIAIILLAINSEI